MLTNNATDLLSFDICSTMGETEGRIYIFLLSKDVLGCADCIGKSLPFFCDPVSLQCILDPWKLYCLFHQTCGKLKITLLFAGVME